MTWWCILLLWSALSLPVGVLVGKAIARGN